MMRFCEQRDVPSRSRMGGYWRSECFSAGSKRRRGALGADAVCSIVATARGGTTRMSHSDFTWWSMSERPF
jgi:hypothetical protein